jgi:hypothetical protein
MDFRGGPLTRSIINLLESAGEPDPDYRGGTQTIPGLSRGNHTRTIAGALRPYQDFRGGTRPGLSRGNLTYTIAGVEYSSVIFILIELLIVIVMLIVIL